MTQLCILNKSDLLENSAKLIPYGTVDETTGRTALLAVYANEPALDVKHVHQVVQLKVDSGGIVNLTFIQVHTW